ncbi:hypothetical protein BV898_05912 [Hypsibius exemplaris]|uniref:Chromatin assembly factor 1 subunit A dimerization domain-containing protein n=1 Tax=Hypsibius exemplaris TaxID=2072580 RepID=A0A1W0WY58_HYPEX|nr:hypothetical protein BV898_05912 [Hypsibius exemplaris]
MAAIRTEKADSVGLDDSLEIVEVKPGDGGGRKNIPLSPRAFSTGNENRNGNIGGGGGDASRGGKSTDGRKSGQPTVLVQSEEIILCHDSDSEGKTEGMSSRSTTPEILPSPSLNASRISTGSGLNSTRDSEISSSTNKSANGSLTGTKPKKVIHVTPTGMSTPRQASRGRLTPAEKLERARVNAERKEKLQAEKEAREAKKRQESAEKERQRKKREDEKAAKDADAKKKADEKEEARKKREKEKEEEAKKKAEEKQKKEEERLRKEAEKKKQDDEKAEQRRQKEREAEKKLADKIAVEEKKKRDQAKQAELMKSIFKPVEKPVVPEIEESGLGIFLTYQIQKGVHLAPKLRVPVPSPEKLRQILGDDSSRSHNPYPNPFYAKPENLYVGELKSRTRKPKTSPPTMQRAASGAVQVMGLIHQAETLKPKLIHFSENVRPPLYGTMRRKSRIIRGRNPFAKDVDLLEYDVDSDDEWEEEQAAGDADECAEDEAKSEDDGDAEMDGWLEDDAAEMGCNDSHNDGLTDDDDEIHPVRSSVAAWMKMKKLQRLQMRVVGPYWSDQEEECPKILRKLRMVEVVQDIGDVLRTATCHEDVGFLVNKIPENVFPCLIRLLHGSAAGQGDIALKFLELVGTKDLTDFTIKFPTFDPSLVAILTALPRQKDVTHKTVKTVINNIAVRCKPTAPSVGGEQLQKTFCWMVREDVRKFYQVLPGHCLPNPSAVRVAIPEKRKASEMDSATPLRTPPVKATKVETPKTNPCTPPPTTTTDSPEVETPKRVKTIDSYYAVSTAACPKRVALTMSEPLQLEGPNTTSPTLKRVELSKSKPLKLESSQTVCPAPKRAELMKSEPLKLASPSTASASPKRLELTKSEPLKFSPLSSASPKRVEPSKSEPLTRTPITARPALKRVELVRKLDPLQSEPILVDLTDS